MKSSDTPRGGTQPGTLIGFANAIHLVIGATAGRKGPIKIIRVGQCQLGIPYADGVMSIKDVLQPRGLTWLIPPGGQTIKEGTE